MATPALQMLTANRLRDGDVVYWRADGWVQAFSDGDVFAAEADAKAALEAAQKSVAGNVVVNPYLFDVRDEEGGITPVKERELIRAAGPTGARRSGQASEGLSTRPARRALPASTRRPPHKGEVKVSPRAGTGDDDVSI